MSLIVPAIPFNQRHVRMYSAVVHPRALEHFSIDIWNPKSAASRRGYQRKFDDNRIKQISKYFERRDAIMPVAGLVNVREKGHLKYRNGKLTIPDGTEVWVVDMQHRLKGLLRAREEGVIGNDLEFPVVITEGLTQTEEAAQFYIINTKAKRMDVALTRRLLIERGMIRDIADVQPWEIKAVQATIALNNVIRNNPWYGAIRQPNEEKLLSHTATEKSFVASLRQLFMGSWKNKRPTRAATELASMWNSIREAIPEAFKEPRKSLIQKTHGMFAFNFFLAPVLLTRHKKDFYRKLLGLRDLGEGFWNSKNKHGARRFGTGMGGYSNLAEYIKRHTGL